MKLVILSSLLFFGSIVMPLRTMSADDSSRKETTRLLVHLLDYLAKDYAGAVSTNKSIISKTEYAEQVEFAKKALETGTDIGLSKDSHLELKKLLTLIEDKSAPEIVINLARTIQQDVIEVTSLEVYPSKWPNFQMGKKLFAQNCTSCHGSDGKGDGLAGAGMDPKPANFTDAEGTASLTTFGAFNTIRLGVDGTGMIAFPQFSDDELWSISYYVNALRYPQDKVKLAQTHFKQSDGILKNLARLTDDQLLKTLNGNDDEKNLGLIALRTHQTDETHRDFTGLAKSLLSQTKSEYQSGNLKEAKAKAIKAYLEGIEPIEPRIRANDSLALERIEAKMAAVRSSVENNSGQEKVDQTIDIAIQEIEAIDELIKKREVSPMLAFTSAFFILLREGFEAVLIILALLGVIRASDSKKAAIWVHGGWLAGIGFGIFAWFSASWVMNISGVGREMLEGLTAIFAVVVLLYIGFWLHRQTEVNRWNHFLKVKVKGLIQEKNFWGLSTITFIAVFREALETVLFLKAIWIESGDSAKMSLSIGVVSAFLILILLSWLTLNWTKNIPIKKLFTVSSIVMMSLATILIGKGIHSIQETGLVSVTSFSYNLRIDLMGIYPTAESLAAQVFVLSLAFFLWSLGRKPAIAK